MLKKIKKLKKIDKIIITIIILLILVIGVSYAYFIVDIKNSETTSTLIGESGDMVIYYDGGPNIVLGQLTPSNTPFATKNFTITGNTKLNATMNYSITLKKEVNTFTDYGLAYNLTSTNTNSNGTVVPSSSKSMCYMLTGTNDEVLGTGSFTGPTNGSKVHTYSLKLYFPDEDYQVENVGKNFSFYLNIEEGIKTQSECRVGPRGKLNNLILLDNGGASNITEAPTSLFSEINTETENKMYKMEDDYGTSYYYRGAKDYVNNNLIFANHQWKIIRINGDGSIRIIYNGECPGNSCTINSTGTATNMKFPSNHALYNPSGLSAYNLTNYNDAKYVGYMYGGANGAASTSRLQATTNETSTRIKSYLDAWYETNIKNTQYENYISDTIFCNDRQLQSEVGGSSTGTGFGTSTTYYAANYRLLTNKTPTLKCTNQNDRFTTTNYNNQVVLGNKALTYPIGLITADEASVAGLKAYTSNDTNYLCNNHYYWTMSPYSFYATDARVWYVYSDGNFNSDVVRYVQGVRGVVNLTSSTQVTGTGTNLDPYVVV